MKNNNNILNKIKNKKIMAFSTLGLLVVVGAACFACQKTFKIELKKDPEVVDIKTNQDDTNNNDKEYDVNGSCEYKIDPLFINNNGICEKKISITEINEEEAEVDDDTKMECSRFENSENQIETTIEDTEEEKEVEDGICKGVLEEESSIDDINELL